MRKMASWHFNQIGTIVQLEQLPCKREAVFGLKIAVATKNESRLLNLKRSKNRMRASIAIIA